MADGYGETSCHLPLPDTARPGAEPEVPAHSDLGRRAQPAPRMPTVRHPTGTGPSPPREPRTRSGFPPGHFRIKPGSAKGSHSGSAIILADSGTFFSAARSCGGGGRARPPAAAGILGWTSWPPVARGRGHVPAVQVWLMATTVDDDIMSWEIASPSRRKSSESGRRDLIPRPLGPRASLQTKLSVQVYCDLPGMKARTEQVFLSPGDCCRA